MIKVLIVDDNDYDKTQVIIKLLKEFKEISENDIIEVKDTSSAKRILKEEKIDLLMLDIKIPINNGDDADPEGGRILLEDIHLDNTLNKPISIVGISSIDDSYLKVQSAFNNNLWTLLKFDRTSDNWKISLKNKIQYLIDRDSEKLEEVDIAIITALFDRELEAILKLPCNWKEFNIKNDSTIYYKGIIEKNNISLNIIAAACSRMGMSASASLTTKICMTFKPKYIFMTGITAGIEGKCKFGDILVADPAWDWGNGKLTIDKEGNPIFNSSPNQIKIDKRYRELLRKISVNRSYVDQIRNNWNEDIEHILSLHIGPVASGAAVLEDPLIASSIKKQHRELLGIEMEIYGMMLAAESLPDPQPISIAFKSVCDYADPNKNDKWQKYAAYTSATFVYEFIKEHLIN